jgi:hypothetical protein
MAEARGKAKLHERNLEMHLRNLESNDPKERRTAALYMGESAREEALPMLIDMYETDEDKSVRQAAKYALGQFKAVDRALAKGKQSDVELLLKKVEKGQLGKRAPTGALVQLAVVLLVLLALLIAANIFSPQIRDSLETVQQNIAVNNAPSQPRPTLIANARTMLADLQADATALADQYRQVIGGAPRISCDATQREPERLLFPAVDAAANPDLNVMYFQLNEIRNSLDTLRATYTTTCTAGGAVTATDAGAQLQQIIQSQAALEARATELATFREDAAATPTPGLGTPDPITGANPAQSANDLLGIFNLLGGPTGATRQLVEYWTEGVERGESSGCGLGTPRFPEAYVLRNPDVEASPRLVQAAESINAATVLARNSWSSLQAWCSSSERSRELAQRELQSVTLSLQILEAASAELREVASGNF